MNDGFVLSVHKRSVVVNLLAPLANNGNDIDGDCGSDGQGCPWRDGTAVRTAVVD